MELGGVWSFGSVRLYPSYDSKAADILSLARSSKVTTTLSNSDAQNRIFDSLIPAAKLDQ